MATHYIDNSSSGNQYYFTSSNASTSQSSRTYASPVTTSVNSAGYATYPTHTSNQQFRLDNSYQTPQQYQSIGGFSKTTTQQYYAPPPSPQVRATARAVSAQDQYYLQRSPQPTAASPQQIHFQYDSSQQPGRTTGPAVVYQTPGAAQFTHHNVDLWTESPSHGQDYYAQAQRVSVRSVSTGSPQHSQPVSPQRYQDNLQQYYSQLTPEQHQQLLRQQQIQKQQEQSSRNEQQLRVTTTSRQVSSSQPQQRARSESERQRQDEQDYFAAQRQLAAQKNQPAQQQSHPVGIRSLMNRFDAPSQAQPRSRSTAPRSPTSTTYPSQSLSRQAPSKPTPVQSLTAHTMTYSALPKPIEPPVNSAEYYQMQMLSGNPFTSIQQAAAPIHIQHTTPGFGSLRDRFKAGSYSEDSSRVQVQQQKQAAPPAATSGGNNLSSLRDQYMNRAKESVTTETKTEEVQHITRTIVGEDLPDEKSSAKKENVDKKATSDENAQDVSEDL